MTGSPRVSSSKATEGSALRVGLVPVSFLRWGSHHTPCRLHCVHIQPHLPAEFLTPCQTAQQMAPNHQMALSPPSWEPLAQGTQQRPSLGSKTCICECHSPAVDSCCLGAPFSPPRGPGFCENVSLPPTDHRCPETGLPRRAPPHPTPSQNDWRHDPVLTNERTAFICWGRPGKKLHYGARRCSLLEGAPCWL